jgi:inositol-phosphate transport system substrate-binding protein
MLALPALAEAAARARPTVQLRAWSQVTPGVDVWRNRALRLAAPKVGAFRISLVAEDLALLWTDYLNQITLAATGGRAANIVVAGHELSAPWARDGWIVPLDEYRGKHRELGAIFDDLWRAVSFDGQTWGVPFEPEARPMFFNKQRLRRLGWSSKQVAALPGRLRAGTFTLDDLVHTARLAIDRGVVPKGLAYWHRPLQGYDFLQYYVAYGGKLYSPTKRKLVLRRKPLIDFYAFQRRVVEEELTPRNFIGTDWDSWHSTVANGKCLFWNGGIWMWAEWREKYFRGDGERDLFRTIGYGLQPTGNKGVPGRTLSRPLSYFVTSKKASGASGTTIDAAAALLAKSMRKEWRTPEALQSAHLAWLEPQIDSPSYRRDRFLSSVTYMLKQGSAFFIPNDANFALYNTIVFDNMLRAEEGEISPRRAADAAIARMRAELRDAVLVE